MYVTFLFDNQLNVALENIIKESNQSLWLISPYIDLDAKTKDALREKINNSKFELRILYGKNKKNIKEDNLDFFKSFPNVEIRYNERLHAKFYLGDYKFLLSSMNLYKYSIHNNIEVGILGEHKIKGKLLRILKAPDYMVLNGIETLSSELLGTKKEENPIQKFIQIFSNSELLFKQQTERKSFINSFLNSEKKPEITIIDKFESKYKNSNLSNNKHKLYSATQISKTLNLSIKEINSFATTEGLIFDGKLLVKGEKFGLVMKFYKDNPYIAYPEHFIEIIRNQK